MNVTDPRAQKLALWLGRTLGATSCAVAALTRLKGGAIQENWLIEARLDGLSRAFVLRKDAPARIGESHSRADEFAILRAAFGAGVAVPEPIALCSDADVFGGPFALMAKVEGVALGPRVVRDPSLGGDRVALTRRLGRELARIHGLAPGSPGLEILGPAPADPAHSEIARLCTALDHLGMARPALEWGLRWAQRCAPPPSRITLTHRDFRTGNYMVDRQGLTAILDWEFAGWGDPHADLGWFCAACWRFGRADLEGGGIGARADLYAGYAGESGIPVDDEAVRYWEVMAHLRWAVIALQQGARHSSGVEPSLELALTGAIVPELELAMLRATAPAAWSRHAR
jgi:aminoglycoside phosphotransferase (APT) family kinase protein